MRILKPLAIMAAVALAAPPALGATLYQLDGLIFTTDTPQSAWGEGDAQEIRGSERLTQSWNESATLGAIVNKETITNPLWSAWKLCKDTVNVLCGDEPTRRITVTIPKTGGKATVKTTGEAGVQMDYLLSAGSVDPTLEYSVLAEVPDVGEVQKDELFNLNAKSTFEDGTLKAQSPTAEVSVDTVLKSTVDVSGEACFAGACTSGSERIINVNDQSELVSVDPNRINFLDGFLPDDAEAFIPLGNVEASLNVGPVPPNFNVTFNNGLPALPGPIGPSVDLATVAVTVPIIESEGAKVGDKLVTSGSSDFLDLKVDLDAAVPYIPPGGLNFDVGPVGISVDAYDIEAGPSLDVFQEFELTSKLMVDLAFDKPVFVSGLGEVTEYVGAWDALPDMSVSSLTKFTPTFFLDVILRNKTGLQFGLELTVEFLKASIGVGPINGTLGPLVDFIFNFDPEFAKFNVYDNSFTMSGFNKIVGDSFYVAPVPLPASLVMLLAALGGLGVLRRRRQTVV